MSEVPASTHNPESLPEHRTGLMPVEDLMRHIRFKIEYLPKLCIQNGIAPDVEGELLAHLERELATLAGLRPDLTLPEALALQRQHREAAAERDAIVCAGGQAALAAQNTAAPITEPALPPAVPSPLQSPVC